MTSVGRVVPNRRPIVRLSIQRPDDREHEIEALLDTGFNGFLALPSSLIEAFSLPHLGREQVTLASGKTHLIPFPRPNVGLQRAWNSTLQEEEFPRNRLTFNVLTLNVSGAASPIRDAETFSRGDIMSRSSYKVPRAPAGTPPSLRR